MLKTCNQNKGYITHVTKCQKCGGAVGIFGGGVAEHIEYVTKGLGRVADEVKVVVKDHRPVIVGGNRG